MECKGKKENGSLPVHKEVANAWYRRYAQATTHLVGPSEKDYLTAYELCQRTPDTDTLLRAIDPFFTQDFFFNTKNGKRSYLFASWASNITAILDGAKPKRAPTVIPDLPPLSDDDVAARRELRIGGKG